MEWYCCWNGASRRSAGPTEGSTKLQAAEFLHGSGTGVSQAGSVRSRASAVGSVAQSWQQPACPMQPLVPPACSPGPGWTTRRCLRTCMWPGLPLHAVLFQMHAHACAAALLRVSCAPRNHDRVQRRLLLLDASKGVRTRAAEARRHVPGRVAQPHVQVAAHACAAFSVLQWSSDTF
jgi:hypothetical protein